MSELSQERRAMLAEKSERLYGKFCGTGGRGICAESFCVYHIGRGETAVAHDFVEFLDDIIRQLHQNDPENRLQATIGLVARIRTHLNVGLDESGSPTSEMQQTGLALRQFVYESASKTEECTISPTD
ncbi:MAG: hypothetical protein R3B84_24600 [Zavarzinella sp.]